MHMQTIFHATLVCLVGTAACKSTTAQVKGGRCEAVQTQAPLPACKDIKYPVTINGVADEVTYLGKGKTGVVYLRSSDLTVVKIPFATDQAKDWYDREKHFFVDVMAEIQSQPQLAEFSKQVVATSEVTVTYGDQTVSALEKAKAQGTPLDMLDESKQTDAALLAAYDRLFLVLRSMFNAGFKVGDLHEGNLVFDGSEIKIVDALFDGKIERAGQQSIIFQHYCDKWVWCKEKIERDFAAAIAEITAGSADRAESADDRTSEQREAEAATTTRGKTGVSGVR